MVPREYIYPIISVTGGSETGIALPILTRGMISKLLVVQLSGTLDGFTYQLYNAKAACPPGANPTTVATGNSVPYQIYAVTPPFVVASTKSQFSTAEGSSEDGTTNLNFAYMNCDNTTGPANLVTTASSTNAMGYLYLKLNVSGTGAKTFGVSITGLAPIY